MQDKKRIKIETKEFVPEYGSEQAAGFDIKAYIPEEKEIRIGSGEIIRIPTGMKWIIPEGYEVQLRSRSGLSYKHGIVVNQGTATIDSDFRGEIGILLRNVSGKPFYISHGMRLVQGILAPVTRASFEVIPQVKEDTERGSGAYGSTGTH